MCDLINLPESLQTREVTGVYREGTSLKSSLLNHRVSNKDLNRNCLSCNSVLFPLSWLAKSYSFFFFNEEMDVYSTRISMFQIL